MVGVWAGNSDNSPVVNIFSTTISFPIMRDTMLLAYDGQPQTQFEQPAGIVRKSTCVPGPQPKPDPLTATATWAAAGLHPGGPDDHAAMLPRRRRRR